MKKVYIIGNNASNNNISDGGRIKIRLYDKLLKKIGGECEIIDLYRWYFHIFKIRKKIKSAINENSIILIMAGPKGCRIIIPFVNNVNKLRMSRVLFCPLGVGTLDKIFSKLEPCEISNFLNESNYKNCSDYKMEKQLCKIDVIFPQNEILANAYRNFYNLNNVETLNNFRDIEIVKKSYNIKPMLECIYASRVCLNKGIFDLLSAVKKINNSSIKIKLDIYGDIQLDNEEKKKFESFLNEYVSYKGIADQDEMVHLLKKYDLFVLPTKYHGEGTPGSLIESMIAGTPVLSSSYSQSSLLIDNMKTGFIYEINNVDDLVNKLNFILNNKDILENIGLKAQSESDKFLFKNNVDKFKRIIYGD